MDPIEAVGQLLWADATFKAASPGGIADTLLPEGAPLPATTYQDVGGASDPTFDTSGMQRARIEFDCRADDSTGGMAAARAARKALIAALNGQHGVTLADGTWMDSAILISPGYTFFDDDARQYRARCEFYVMYLLPDSS